jgi:hypothetical protein
MANLSTNAAVNEIAALLGAAEEQTTNGALNLIADAITAASGSTINPDSLPLYDYEDYVNTGTGTKIPGTSSVSAGGTVSATQSYLGSNWNSAATKFRPGASNISITSAASSRAGLGTAASYRVSTAQGSDFSFGSELAFTSSSVITASDDVFIGWGLLTSVAAYPSAASGVYFRVPTSTETAFLKYAVRIAGVESPFDTTIPYDSTDDRFVKTQITYTSANNTLTFYATDGTNESTSTIATASTTYPTLAAVSMVMGYLVARNGTTVTPLARTISVDKSFRTSPKYF